MTGSRVNAVSRQLEEKLESYLHNEPTLRAIQNRRRREATQEKLTDDKPLSHVLERLMKKNPLLNQIFLQGMKITAPFPPSRHHDESAQRHVRRQAIPELLPLQGSGRR